MDQHRKRADTENSRDAREAWKVGEGSVVGVVEGKEDGDGNEWFAGLKGGQSHPVAEKAMAHTPIIG